MEVEEYKTDVDKLHSLINDLEEHPEGIFWRRVGKSTLQIHELAGEIQVGEHDRILVKTKFCYDLSWILPMLEAIFSEQGIEIIRFNKQQSTMDIMYEGKLTKLHFISSEDYYIRSRGYNCLEFSVIDY